MTPTAAWRLLGIDPTADASAIRRAYAARLRAMDVDADRDGFADLRDARDLALQLAAEGTLDPEPADEAAPAAPEGEQVAIPVPQTGFGWTGALAGTGDPALSLSPPDGALHPAALAPDVRPAADAPGDVLPLPDPADLLACADKAGGWYVARHGLAAEEARADRALHALLFPRGEDDDREQLMTAEEEEQAQAALAAVIADVRGGDIDQQARGEIWIADILAHGWPRSDPLLAPAADAFGWRARAGLVDTPPAVDYVNQRLAARDFRTAVERKDHQLHGAWKQLRKPTRTGQSRALWWEGRKIDELLGIIRRDYPELEQQLDWHRVALWDARGQKPIRSYTWIFIAIVVVQLLSAIGRMAGPSGDASSPASLAEAVDTPQMKADIGDVLVKSLGSAMAYDEFARDHGGLQRILSTNWRMQDSSGNFTDSYARVMDRLLRDRYVLMAHELGGDHLLALQRLRLKIGRALRKDQNWAACNDLYRTGLLPDPALLPDDLAALQRQQMGALLLSVDTDPAPQNRKGGTYKIPGAIVQATLDGSGLPLDRVQAVYQGGGEPRDVCLVDTAMLAAILDAAPAVRGPLIDKI
ncbi:hypothetical protein GGR44_002159 [Sphingobium fontiphilum]|uniref:J domain-containing protein n=1 Tax=Sphingobium fontiphilum TaxID=944425 RepID=A0A7W6DJI7_9SPHN|nr:hypothetical protein [Sphingobium fontiphilum]MBB3982496.1 hypothetical protein [Sphingobium fontiphilum]